MVFTLKWGILATGGIAKTFSKDLLIDPATRNVSDVAHKIVAVAASSSVERAKQFLKDVNAPADAKAYGSYKELVEDPDVDVIYVATPHSHHYEHAKLALEAGKNVLCEKPFTINHIQTAKLIELAKQKNVFLMEAVWIRLFPLTLELQRLLFKEKVIGEIKRVKSDLSMPFGETDVEHRLLNPDLGGGALLDLGVYALTWSFIVGYDNPANERTAPEIVSSIRKVKTTGVDGHTTAILNFPKSGVQAIASTSIDGTTDKKAAVYIDGEKGHIKIPWATYRPESFELYLRDKDEDYTASGNGGEPTKVYKFDIPGQGMFWEADETARCIRDGKKESDIIPLAESLEVMKTMDTIRKQNNFEYPAKIEAAD